MKMIAETIKRLNRIENGEWREKTKEILIYLDKKYVYSFSPAAKKFHHNYRGGLQIHTCEVIDFAIKINELAGEPYPQDDVIIAAFLHDLEKAYVYKWRLVQDECGDTIETMEIDRVSFPCSDEAIVFRLLAKVGLELPFHILSAIEFAHGGWSTQANNKHINQSPLASIIHSADLLSSVFGDVGPDSLNLKNKEGKK